MSNVGLAVRRPGRRDEGIPRRRPADAKPLLRPDVQALRALADLAVLGFHLAPARLPGGFAGVDVFFVISGFLITGNLLREALTTGHLRLGRFWARRIRRLFPAAATVLVATAAATFAWVPENLWRQYFREIAASALYLQNWVLAADSVDYLASENSASPAQHFWTLSVEEQFYLVVPLLMLLLLALSGFWSRGRSAAEAAAGSLDLTPRRTLFAGLLCVTGLSLAYCVWLTGTSQPVAYFLTPARGWEFGIGGLLAFATGTPTVRAGAAGVLGGLAALGAAVFLLSENSAFPGWLAVWPVLATAAVLWGGRSPERPLAAMLALRPVQFLGSISYSVYLWHWPLLVLLPFVTGHPLNRLEKVAVVAATLALAAASTRYVEDPIRHSVRRVGVQRNPVPVTAWCATAMAATAVLSLTGMYLTDRSAGRSADRVAVPGQAACLGAATVTEPGCTDPSPLDGQLVPEPAHAGQDHHNRRDCWSSLGVSELHLCTLGPADARTRLVAVGDSHSNSLLAAYEGIAERTGWRIDVAGHNGCYLTIAVQAQIQQSHIDACEEWKRRLRTYLAGQAPYDALLVTFAHDGAKVIVAPGADLHQATVAGLREEWSEQARRGTRVIAIRDNPTMERDVVSCVTRYGATADEHCSRSATEALDSPDALTEAVPATPNSRLVDLSDIYCPEGRCVPIIGSVVAYLDAQHVTATFARSLIPALEPRIRAALPAGPGELSVAAEAP